MSGDISNLNENAFLQRLIEMTPEERRITEFEKGGRRKYRPPARLNYTCRELIEWAREKEIKTQQQLSKKRVIGDPNRDSFVRAFGSWSRFKYEAYGDRSDPRMGEPPSDVAYILKLINKHSAWTARRYREIRRELPDIFPTIDQVICQFGSWGKAKYTAQRMSHKGRVEQYVELRKRYNRWPTIPECKKQNLDISVLIQIHGSKRAFDVFLERTENIDAI